MKEDNALQKMQQVELLSIENKNLVAAAAKLNRKPENLIRQIAECLPTKVEQAIGIELIKEFGHQPLTIKKVLMVVNHGETLKDQDLHPVPGKGSRLSKVEHLLPLLENVLELILRLPNDYDGLRLGAHRASMLVLVYGDQADTFLDSLFADCSALVSVFKMRSSSKLDVIRRALHVWEHEVLPYCDAHGLPFPLSLYEFYSETGQVVNSDDEIVEPEDEESDWNLSLRTTMSQGGKYDSRF